MKLTLSVLPEKFAVCRLDINENLPSWVETKAFYSISKTADELSIVCLQKNVPAEIKTEKDWRILKVEGPLDFGLTGILASLANPLAEAKISIFAISTFDTDYVLVKEEKLGEALQVLGSFCTINSLD